MMKTRFFAAPYRGGRDTVKIFTDQKIFELQRDGDKNLKTELRAERFTRAALGHGRAVGSKRVSIHGYVWSHRPGAIPIEHRIVKAISSDCFEQFGYE
jgi:hypothetical protein